MFDPTEDARRVAQAVENATAKAAPSPEVLRADLEARYPGDVYDTAEMSAKFKVLGFMAPFVLVQRIEDKTLGTLTFCHAPRFYYGFVRE